MARAAIRPARWVSLADTIVSDTAGQGRPPLGTLAALAGRPRVDAALLLPAIRGAIPAADPRSIATLEAVASELTQDGYCYRYRPDERPLGRVGRRVSALRLLMALALRPTGRRMSAARWFERNRAASGPPGLYSEEFDVTQRQLRGNLPQAFVHTLLLECAVAVAGDGDGAPRQREPLASNEGDAEPRP